MEAPESCTRMSPVAQPERTLLTSAMSNTPHSCEDIHRTWRVAAGVAVVALAALSVGCSTSPPARPAKKVWTKEQQEQYLQERRARVRVIMQVCLKDGPDRVRLTAVAGPPFRSLDSGPMYPAGTTVAGEPVFEGYSNALDEHEADIVRLASAPDMQHGFTLAGGRPDVDWSAWRAPQMSSADRELLWRMTRGESLGSGGAQANPHLLARYRLMTFGQYLDRIAARRLGTQVEDFAPACSAP